MPTIQDVALADYEYNLTLALISCLSLEKYITAVNKKLPALLEFLPGHIDPGVTNYVNELVAVSNEAKILIDEYKIESSEAFIISLEAQCYRYKAIIEKLKLLANCIGNDVFSKKQEISYEPRFIESAISLCINFRKMSKPLLDPKSTRNYIDHTSYILTHIEDKKPEGSHIDRVAAARSSASEELEEAKKLEPPKYDQGKIIPPPAKKMKNRA